MAKQIIATIDNVELLTEDTLEFTPLSATVAPGTYTVDFSTLAINASSTATLEFAILKNESPDSEEDILFSKSILEFDSGEYSETVTLTAPATYVGFTMNGTDGVEIMDFAISSEGGDPEPSTGPTIRDIILEKVQGKTGFINIQLDINLRSLANTINEISDYMNGDAEADGVAWEGFADGSAWQIYPREHNDDCVILLAVTYEPPDGEDEDEDEDDGK